ncbi:MAG: hypothetical protein ABFD52_10145 [Acidobacteriota bacterium]
MGALLVLLVLPAPAARPSQAAAAGSEAGTLTRALAQAGDYCARLARASIDFVCLEEVTERIQERNPVYPASAFGRPGWRNDVVEHQYLYDYQFVTEDGQRTEKRRVLKIDGIKRKDEAADLDTLTFLYKNVLFGAVDLLDETRQGFYRYALKGREMMDGQPALVIEATAAPGLAVDVHRGTVWLRESDAAILKIVWNGASLERNAAIRMTAKEFKGAPQILQVTEFGLEKNGVRFPTRFAVEEAYITKRGRKVVRSTMDAVYRDYKFFTVEVATTGIKGP